MGETMLHLACAVNNAELVKYIISLGAPLDVPDADGTTPLLLALRYTSWTSAEILVERGCQVNTQNNYGLTPLNTAIASQYEDITVIIKFGNALLSRGASLGTTDRYGSGVWHWVARSRPLDEKPFELYQWLFDAGGADLTETRDSWGQTPLMRAIIQRNVSLIYFLQWVSARCDVVDHAGDNLLHCISTFGDSRCCSALQGFQIHCLDIRTTNHEGFTPLEVLRYNIWHYNQRYQRRTDGLFEDWLFWQDQSENNTAEDIVSEDKVEAFENILRSIRDRMLIDEIKELEAIILKIQTRNPLSARDHLRRLAEGKVKAKIGHEAETFRAIELDIREGRLRLAIESIREFIKASRDRMKLSPFEEEENEWPMSEIGSEVSDEGLDDERTVVEFETYDEEESGWWGEDDDICGENGYGRTEFGSENDEDEGWKTAEEE